MCLIGRAYLQSTLAHRPGDWNTGHPWHQLKMKKLRQLLSGSVRDRSESVERKDNDTEPTAEDGTPTKLCSECGKKSNSLKKCTACKCVWYCDKECQNKHRKEHKHECRPIKKELDKRGGKLNLGTEVDIGPLGIVPPREDCPICMRALPLHSMLHTYAACCSKTVCSGCNFQHGMRNREANAKRAQREPPLPPLPLTCAFCRTAAPASEEETLLHLRKTVERKDPNALFHMAIQYGYGHLGLPVDQAKCVDLMRQSAGLGSPDAQFQLGMYYDNGLMGLEQNEEKGTQYYKEASEGGHALARYNLGLSEVMSGDDVAAMRHWRLSASGGYRTSIDSLISCFMDGVLHHGDLADTLQAFYLARAEMKSDDRDQYIGHLKMTGEYDADCEKC